MSDPNKRGKKKGGGALTPHQIRLCPRPQRRPDDTAPLARMGCSARRCPRREATKPDGPIGRGRSCRSPEAPGRGRAGRVGEMCSGSGARRFPRTRSGRLARAMAIPGGSEAGRPWRLGCRSAVVVAVGSVLLLSWVSSSGPEEQRFRQARPLSSSSYSPRP